MIQCNIENSQKASPAIGLSDGWRPHHNALDLLLSKSSVVSGHITDLLKEHTVMVNS